MTDQQQAERGAREATAAPTRGQQSVNGITLAYLDYPAPGGAGRCPPVVLLHGVLQTKEGMANLAAHLARRSRVVVPDLRGRGESAQPATGYDPDTMADDVAALIQRLALDRPLVIGRMHGGLVAYRLAARHPALVRGLVIGDTPPEVDAARAARVLGIIRDLPPSFPSLDAAVAYYQDVLGLSEARARHDIPHDLIAEPDGSYRWRHNRGLIERIETASLPRADWDLLARIRCPVLVLRGQRGEIPQAMADRICQVIPDCAVRTILGMRHDLFIGPGCEQALGELDLFQIRLSDDPPPIAGAGAAATAGDGGDGGNGGAPGHRPEPGARLVDRLIAAVNGRDAATFEALFAPDVHAVQYAEGGKVREGGIETARAAFGRVFSGAAGAQVEARDVVAAGDRLACVFIIKNETFAATRLAHHAEARATVVPAFCRLRDDRIVELVTFHLHIPITQAADLP